MSWFKSKFGKDYEPEIVANDIPISTLFRWYLYDTGLADPNDLAELVGLSKVSEEGDSKEREESALRIAGMVDVFPFLDTISDFAAETMVAMQQIRSKAIGEDWDEDDVHMHRVVFKAAAMSALIGTFSIGNSLGLIHSNILHAEHLEMETDYDE